MSFLNADKRPRIRGPWLPVGVWEWVLEVASLGILLFWVAYLAAYWDVLPDLVPSGFNAGGVPRGDRSKPFLLLLPTVMFFIYVVITGARRFPHWSNFPVTVTEENAPHLYAIGRRVLAFTKFQTIAMMGYIEWKMIQTGRGEAPGMNEWVTWGFIALMLVTLIYAIWAMRRVE